MGICRRRGRPGRTAVKLVRMVTYDWEWKGRRRLYP